MSVASRVVSTAMLSVAAFAGIGTRANATIRHQTLAPGQTIIVKTGVGPGGHRFTGVEDNQATRTPTSQSPFKIYVHRGKKVERVAQVFEENPKEPWLIFSTLNKHDSAFAFQIQKTETKLSPDKSFQVLGLSDGVFALMRPVTSGGLEVSVEGDDKFVQPIVTADVPKNFGSAQRWMSYPHPQRPMALHVLSEGLGDRGALGAALAGNILLNPPISPWFFLTDANIAAEKLEYELGVANRRVADEAKQWRAHLAVPIAAAYVTDSDFLFARVGDVQVLHVTGNGQVNDLTADLSVDTAGLGVKKRLPPFVIGESAGKLAPQDVLVLATKALRERLSDADIVGILGNAKADAEQMLVRTAAKRTSTKDNQRALGAKIVSHAMPVSGWWSSP